MDDDDHAPLSPAQDHISLARVPSPQLTNWAGRCSKCHPLAIFDNYIRPAPATTSTLHFLQLEFLRFNKKCVRNWHQPATTWRGTSDKYPNKTFQNI